MRTVHFLQNSGGRWRRNRATGIETGIVAGTGNSTIFTKNNQGVWNVPHIFPVQIGQPAWNEVETNRSRVRYVYRSPFSPKKFVVHIITVASYHSVTDDNLTQIINLMITDQCE